MDDLKYPIGKFIPPTDFSKEALQLDMDTLSTFPDQLAGVIDLLGADRLEQKYRPEGWTARQVIHHVCDSHTHALIRFKWALSEDEPVIKPYREAEYARLYDYNMPPEISLSMIRAVHQKLLYIMSHMTGEEWLKGYHHPESKRHFRLYEVAALYAWHCRHHLAHLHLCTENG